MMSARISPHLMLILLLLGGPISGHLPLLNSPVDGIAPSDVQVDQDPVEHHPTVTKVRIVLSPLDYLFSRRNMESVPISPDYPVDFMERKLANLKSMIEETKKVKATLCSMYDTFTHICLLMLDYAFKLEANYKRMLDFKHRQEQRKKQQPPQRLQAKPLTSMIAGSR